MTSQNSNMCRYIKIKRVNNAFICLKRLSEHDIFNANSVSEIMPNKANKANANSGDRQTTKPVMGADASLEP